MTPRRNDFICLLGAMVLLGTKATLMADAKPNPYEGIVERNAFGLRPPPPPQSETAPAPPPAPLAKVMLTGITSMFGPSSKRALLEIIEQEPGKAATPRKPILREGEHDGSVEVIAIDVEKNMVKIRNGTVETNITFEVQKSAPASAAPAAPLMAANQPPITPAPAPALGGGAAPMIISRDSGASQVSGGGVTIIGANNLSSSPSGFSSAKTTTYGASGTGSSFSSATASSFSPGDGGLRIPSRQVRTDTANLGNQQQNQQPYVPRDQQAVLIEINRELSPGGFPPLPPTGLNPGAGLDLPSK